MCRSLRLILALSAFAAFAHADTLHLAAPANGVTLRGGSFAELRWDSARVPNGAEEWEAFLSVNGGKYYAFRVTPHLDLDLQRFTFVVPNVDTHDARILIRIGNEVAETLFETSGRFSIVRDAKAERVLPQLIHHGHAEAARPGDPPVVGWTDGARNGSDITQSAATNLPAPSIGPLGRIASDTAAVLAVSGIVVTPTRFDATSLATQRRILSRDVEPLTASIDLLLVCRRRNI